MAIVFDHMPLCDALVKMAGDFHRRGWMAGTAGNLSARDPEQLDSFWVTASGNPKGQLEQSDFLQIDVNDGSVVESLKDSNKPSAESSIHQVIYQLFPEARCCLHVHTVTACIATEACSDNEIQLPQLEMIKGMGVWEQSPQVMLPLFDNWLAVPEIASDIMQRFTTQPPDISALMIRQHGLTVWGGSLQQAYNRLEIMEYIMSYMALAR